jgi:hypothetical protein
MLRTGHGSEVAGIRRVGLKKIPPLALLIASGKYNDPVAHRQDFPTASVNKKPRHRGVFLSAGSRRRRPCARFRI